jgi:uncharacterized damage-inducible protein DinB
MIDDFAKAYLHDNLRWVRESLLLKLEGLSEYDVRRPLTRTGTNLLGLVKHLALSEARYLGEILGRPFPESLPRFEDPGYRNHDHLWVTEQETRTVGDLPATGPDGTDWEAHRSRIEEAARAALSER